MEIKPSHEMFCQEVVKQGGNQTNAYLKVYPKAKYPSARHSASLLLTNVYIKQRIYEILEQNGLGLPVVAKKLNELMNVKDSRLNEKGERILVDRIGAQIKTLDLILRLYDSLIKSGTAICLTSEEVAQIEQMVKEFEVLNQKKQDNP